MQEIGLIAFIAGMIAGFISLRSLGWLCLAFVLALPVSGWSATGAGTMNLYAVGSPGNGKNYRFLIGGSTCPAGAQQDSGVISGGQMVTHTYSPMTLPASMQISIFIGGVYQSIGCVVINDSQTYNWQINVDDNSYTNGAPPVNYISSGCVTNNTASVANFYMHFTPTLDDGTHDLTSGPLAPGQWWCINKTNSVPFQTQVEMVLYNSDGGTNTLDIGSPGWAGTNGTNPSPYPQPGNPYPGNPIKGGPGDGTGAGSTNPVTGGNYSAGVSNIINVYLSMGNELMGGLNGIRRGTDILTNLPPNMATNRNDTNFDYRAYFDALTNQGAMTTNLLSRTNDLAGWTNAFRTNAPFGFSGWYTDEASYSNGVFAAANADSNYWFTSMASGGQVGNIGQATNWTSDSGVSGTLFTLPLYSNVTALHAGVIGLNVDFTNNAMWSNITPWMLLAGYFMITIFAIGYVHMRVQEEVGRIATMVSGGSSMVPIKLLLGRIGMLVAISVGIGAFPIIISGAMNWILGYLGGFPVSPFSDSGIANAGVYANAVKVGFNILNAVFPWKFAVATMIYLFFFDHVVTGAVLSAARIMKMFNL